MLLVVWRWWRLRAKVLGHKPNWSLWPAYLNVGKPDAGIFKYQVTRSAVAYARRQLSGLGWCRLLGSGSAISSRLPIQILSVWHQESTSSRNCGWGPKCVMTPADAYRIGSDYIVVGRPIASWGSCCSLCAIRMNGTETEMKEIGHKNKRRILWLLLKISIATSRKFRRL